MKVLMITGDKKFVTSERFALQASQVEKLSILYMGHGAWWPAIPKEQFEVVTAQDPFWRGLYAWYVARRLGARFNVQVHTDLSAQSLVRHILSQIILRHASSIRVVSEKIKAQVEQIGVRVPVHVLPIYLDVKRFAALERKPNMGNKKIILWIGRFEAEKDPAYAVSILKEVRAQGIDVKLVMLGAGSFGKKLQQAAAGLPVEFPGWQDPLPYLEVADVVLCTSKHESWGASIIEALAGHVSVVAPDVGIAREAGAYIAKRGELAAKVEEVLKNNMKGKLTLNLLSSDEWATAWRESL
jgi:glycosyltransferase involved in cell wall biosynthesis